jgi:hypothetical protein
VGVRFSGISFEWDMAFNNLPSIIVQAVMPLLTQIHARRYLLGVGMQEQFSQQDYPFLKIFSGLFQR